MTRILVVTAAAAERDAVVVNRTPAIGMIDGIEVHRALTGAGMVDVIASGVGVAAAAVGTACALRAGYDLVMSAGIAGGFAPTDAGDVVVARAVVHADLGAQTPTGFASMAELGWGAVRFELSPPLVRAVSHRTGAEAGAILTVSTVTGTQQRADELLAAHPDAIAEAMEGIGVYRAAERAGLPFVELRAISNRVGPRDTDSWQIGSALTALTKAFDELFAEPLTTEARMPRR